MATGAGAEALQDSTFANELVESTTIEELEFTVRGESDGDSSQVHDEVVRDLVGGEEELDESKEHLDVLPEVYG